MFTIDLPRHPVFGEVVVAPHPPSRSYHARLIYKQPDHLGHRLPIDDRGRIICPVVDDVDLSSLIERLHHRLGDFDLDQKLIDATRAWVRFAPNAA